jgi:hypothetical protein
MSGAPIKHWKKLEFEHATVCHKYFFVFPQTGMHTQNVESYNNHLKMKIKTMKSIKSDDFNDFIVEFMWRERVYKEWRAVFYLLSY